MELAKLFQQFGIALGLGLLVGWQRERTDSRLAGFRTFPLITLLGALCALLGDTFGGWIVGFGLAALAVIIFVGNLPVLKSEGEPSGITTEAAMLVMFAVGACLIANHTAVAIAVSGVVAILLHLKPEMHELAARIGDRDFKAIMQFVLVSLVILPVLPNENYGPYQVWNPFRIWLMVVLIVGISLSGYVVYKFVGPKAGTWTSGILGGLISSTATTVSYARRSKQATQGEALAAFVILVASAVVFVRVLLLIGVTAPKFLGPAAVPLATMLAAMSVLSLWTWFSSRAQEERMPEQSNPSELKIAVLFAALYAGVLLAVAAAKNYFGQGGLYVVALLSGLTDMDAITLSVTQLVNNDAVSQSTGWRLILAAAMSNFVFKAATIAVLGNWRLFRRVALAFGLASGVGLLLIFWPA